MLRPSRHIDYELIISPVSPILLGVGVHCEWESCHVDAGRKLHVPSLCVHHSPYGLAGQKPRRFFLFSLKNMHVLGCGDDKWSRYLRDSFRG